LKWSQALHTAQTAKRKELAPKFPAHAAGNFIEASLLAILGNKQTKNNKKDLFHLPFCFFPLKKPSLQAQPPDWLFIDAEQQETSAAAPLISLLVCRPLTCESFPQAWSQHRTHVPGARSFARCRQPHARQKPCLRAEDEEKTPSQGAQVCCGLGVEHSPPTGFGLEARSTTKLEGAAEFQSPPLPQPLRVQCLHHQDSSALKPQG